MSFNKKSVGLVVLIILLAGGGTGIFFGIQAYNRAIEENRIDFGQDLGHLGYLVLEGSPYQETEADEDVFEARVKIKIDGYNCVLELERKTINENRTWTHKNRTIEAFDADEFEPKNPKDDDIEAEDIEGSPKPNAIREYLDRHKDRFAFCLSAAVRKA